MSGERLEGEDWDANAAAIGLTRCGGLAVFAAFCSTPAFSVLPHAPSVPFSLMMMTLRVRGRPARQIRLQ
jgi:hypothetical protein